jgi:hypothetical protein
MKQPPVLLLIALLIVAVAGAVFAVRRRRARLGKVATGAGTEEPVIPTGLAVKPQPLLSKEEASFYNMLRLAVQDRYLVFAQVPLWCLVDAEAADRDVLKTFLNKIALKRADFVLVHPGTLNVAKIVELETPDPPLQRQARDKLVNAVFAAAGLDLVRIRVDQSYTVPALAARLGLEDPE